MQIKKSFPKHAKYKNILFVQASNVGFCLWTPIELLKWYVFKETQQLSIVFATKISYFLLQSDVREMSILGITKLVQNYL